jgi:mannose/cellobiose epimerase-like protein (N-acyl-D-glucosamine 2-epimerase family)
MTSDHNAAPAAPSAHWLLVEEARLLDFATGSRCPTGGFGWLDDAGAVDPGHPVQTWITARMTYVFALAQLRGRPGAAELVDHGLTALAELIADHEFGGWYPTIPGPGTDRDKRAYETSFVLLAAAAAVAVGRPGAAELLAQAMAVIEARFWREDDGLSVDVWNEQWTELEPYRGANANMHLVEAFLVTADVTGETKWRTRAFSIAERLIHEHARAHDWRLPEHYDEQWRPMLEYNRDLPAHPFRPFGSTVGHWMEWARLLCQLHQALERPPAWLLQDAAALFDAAVAQGWAVDGADGFVYTVDFAGLPVVTARMHWVVAEAIGAAAVLSAITGEARYGEWLGIWWRYALDHLVDADLGSWHAELGPDNLPHAGTWSGKPDVYHAYQTVLLTSLPPAGSLVAALLAAR